MQSSPIKVEDLDYDLPPQLIATQPVEPRDSSKLLVMYRSKDEIEHSHVRNLPDYVGQGDALVFNRTSVLPARFLGQRVNTGGRIEGLFVNAVDETHWTVMLKSNGKLRSGQVIELRDNARKLYVHKLELIEQRPEGWLVGLLDSKYGTAILNEVGLTPLPPYILKARKDNRTKIADSQDRQWYETTFADPDERRSVAAPTAGLHFTPDLLHRLDQKGVQRLDIVLDIGLGTFQPIKTKTIDQHEIHTEQFTVPNKTLEALRKNDSRVIAVGTTVVRALESLPKPLPSSEAIASSTKLLIAPPYQFKHIDGMLTNFHLPRSTLLALVGAMVGLERIKAVYSEAVDRKYRFYSYGDAMLILP